MHGSQYFKLQVWAHVMLLCTRHVLCVKHQLLGRRDIAQFLSNILASYVEDAEWVDSGKNITHISPSLKWNCPVQVN